MGGVKLGNATGSESWLLTGSRLSAPLAYLTHRSRLIGGMWVPDNMPARPEPVLPLRRPCIHSPEKWMYHIPEWLTRLDVVRSPRGLLSAGPRPLGFGISTAPDRLEPDLALDQPNR